MHMHTIFINVATNIVLNISTILLLLHVPMFMSCMHRTHCVTHNIYCVYIHVMRTNPRSSKINSFFSIAILITSSSPCNPSDAYKSP